MFDLKIKVGQSDQCFMGSLILSFIFKLILT